MPRPSSIDALSPELRGRLIELLGTPGVTQEQIAQELRDAGASVSKSSVNRYKKRMDRFAERNRQAREVVSAYLAHSGAEGQQDLSESILHQLRTIAFDFLLRLQDVDTEEEGIDPEQFGKLLSQASRSARDIEMAADRSMERRRKLREEAIKEAAEAAVKAGKREGLSQDTVSAIREQVLGVAAS